MAVRQYIGARYVLKIYENSQNPLSADWEPEVPYEPLTMVNYNSSSYISRKEVPPTIGNPVNNPAYWALSGLYNGQIASLENRMTTAENDIDALEEAISRGTYIFTSDSYGDTAYGNLFSELASYLGLSSGEWYDAHYSGGSFAQGTFVTALQNVINTMSAAEKEAVKHVVVLAGINDAGRPVADILSNIEDYCDLVRAELPNADIGIGFIGNVIEPGSNGRNCETRYQALNAYAQCGQYGAKFYKGLENVLHDSSLLRSDGVHPTVDGCKEIAKYAASAILGGQVDVVRRVEYKTVEEVKGIWDRTGTNVSSNIVNLNLFPTTYDNEINVSISHNNDLGSVDFRMRIGLDFGAGVTISYNSAFFIGRLTTPLWKNGCAKYYLNVAGYYQVGSTFGTWRGTLMNYGGLLMLRIGQIDNNWSGAVSGVTQMLFHGFQGTLPTFAM